MFESLCKLEEGVERERNTSGLSADLPDDRSQCETVCSTFSTLCPPQNLFPTVSLSLPTFKGSPPLQGDRSLNSILGQVLEPSPATSGWV